MGGEIGGFDQLHIQEGVQSVENRGWVGDGRMIGDGAERKETRTKMRNKTTNTKKVSK